MLIGSEITCVCFLDILHKVHIGGNHAGSGKTTTSHFDGK